MREGPFVFISYSHVDKEFAIEFAKRLKDAGIPHFRDEEFIGWGEDIPAKVHEAIEMATHLVVLISPGSEQSQWVAYEMGYARGRKIHLIPYLLHPSMKLPGFIASKRYLQSSKDETKFVRGIKRSVTQVAAQKKADSGAKKVDAQAARMLLSPNPQVRKDAVAALVEQKATKELLKALGHTRVEVRVSAASGCAQLVIPEALPYLISGLYGTGRHNRTPVIPGVGNLLKPYGEKAVLAMMKALGERELEWSEKDRWKKAVAATIDAGSAHLVADRVATQPWLLEPLFESGINLREFAPVLDTHVTEKDGKLSSSRCREVARSLSRSKFSSESWVRRIVNRWVHDCFTQHGLTEYASSVPELADEALALKAVSTDEVRRLADGLSPKVRVKVDEILEKYSDPAGTPTHIGNEWPHRG